MTIQSKIEDADIRDSVGLAASVALEASVAARVIQSRLQDENAPTGPRGLAALRSMLGRLGQVRLSRDAEDFDRLFEDDYLPRLESSALNVFARAASPERSETPSSSREALDGLMRFIESVEIDEHAARVVVVDAKAAEALSEFLQSLSRVAVTDAEDIDVQRTSGLAVACR